MKNILFLGNDGAAGIAVYTSTIANYLNNNYNFYNVLNDIDYYRVIYKNQNNILVSRIGKTIFIDVIYIIRIIKKYKISIIHANAFRYGIISAIIKILNPEIKIVYCNHGIRFMQIKNVFLKSIYYILEKKIYKITNINITIRESDFRFVSKISKTINIINQIETIKYQKINEKKFFVVSMIGDNIAIKNPKLFNIIADQYLKKYPNDKIKFYWIGYNSNYIKLNNNVHKIRKINQKALFSILGFIDLIVITSKNETLPYVVIEAGSCGIPTYVNNIQNIEQLVPNESYIYNSNNLSIILGKINKMYTDYEYYNSMSQESKSFYRKKYTDINSMITKYNSIYEGV